MGKRVHVISKRETYGNREAFNWKYCEFHKLLDTLGCNVCVENDDEFSDRFECQVERYVKALKLIKAYKEKGNCSEVKEMFESIYEDEPLDFDEFVTSIKVDFENDVEYVIEVMEDFYNERDKKSNWIGFVAW